MENKNKMYMIGGIVFFVIVLIIGFFIMNNSKKDVVQNNTKDVLPESVVIPTVDSSVEVDLKPQNNNHDFFITVKNVPKGTTDIDYEMNYLVKKTLPQGTIGTLVVTGDTATNSKAITLGTCSSGTCVYYEGVESIELSLKFNSPSGSKSFKKDFPLK
jgi:hypothetical protein